MYVFICFYLCCFVIYINKLDSSTIYTVVSLSTITSKQLSVQFNHYKVINKTFKKNLQAQLWIHRVSLQLYLEIRQINKNLGKYRVIVLTIVLYICYSLT